jgi:hypothetical protein
MSHEIYRVESFTIVAPYTLSVRFDDGTTRCIDFSPHLEGEVFGPLRDLRLFEQVKVDQDAHTLVWPNGADFDPETLHNWPAEPQEVSAAVEAWREQPESVA